MPNCQLNAACFLIVHSGLQLEHEPVIEQRFARVPMHRRSLETLFRTGIRWVHNGNLDVSIYRTPTGTLKIFAAND